MSHRRRRKPIGKPDVEALKREGNLTLGLAIAVVIGAVFLVLQGFGSLTVVEIAGLVLAVLALRWGINRDIAKAEALAEVAEAEELEG
jgi:hypothetical protein